MKKKIETIAMPVRMVDLTERFARERIQFIENQTAS